MVTFPHSESNVTLACQNRCVSCNHFIPMQKPWFIDPADLKRDLSEAAKIMHFDVYNLVGGEPTLHPDIVELLKIVRASGITDRVEVTSNGQGYEKWTKEFYLAVDDLIITPYKLTGADLHNIAARCSSYNVVYQVHPVIFTWAAYKIPHDPELAAGLYRQCWYNVNRHVIDGGYFYRCCTAPFIPSVLLEMPKETDGIPLDGLTEVGLLAYMAQSKTPASCSVCASNRGQVIQWRETSREKWCEESLG